MGGSSLVEDARSSLGWARRGRRLVQTVAAALILSACYAEPDHSLIPPAEPVSVSSSFTPGDDFDVRVFDEPELSGSFQIQEDGTIDFPLLGRTEVAGLTQAEVAAKLEEGLADGFLRDPHVSVIVTARENLEVSVLGQVQRPGTFPFIEQLTLVQAVSTAGGLTDIAHVKRVKLTRKTGEGPKTYDVSLAAITEGRAADIILQPGDIVFVPEVPL